MCADCAVRLCHCSSMRTCTCVVQKATIVFVIGSRMSKSQEEGYFPKNLIHDSQKDVLSVEDFLAMFFMLTLLMAIKIPYCKVEPLFFNGHLVSTATSRTTAFLQNGTFFDQYLKPFKISQCIFIKWTRHFWITVNSRNFVNFPVHNRESKSSSLTAYW